ncbi:hypothetical protein KY290_010660 [Solanum tuberosum]|uniref:Retrotransposon Copia-like N-terminal domain-containing protein n=1 Tax=Solanum tuberosum TaxID=4113 RepID=A0ABQ7VYF9_SOLTU|nr:hypothetical protein KY290_010660 [Solanum tuberosum]
MQHSISTAMVGDSTSTTSGTSSTTHNSFVTAFPSSNLAHQLPVKLTSSNFLLWKTQYLPMIRGCGVDYHIEGDERENASIESYLIKAKGISDRLAALQHPISNDDLVEFVLTGLGPTYRPFTRSLESRQEEISFDALYGMLLNEEWQLN